MQNFIAIIWLEKNPPNKFFHVKLRIQFFGRRKNPPKSGNEREKCDKKRDRTRKLRQKTGASEKTVSAKNSEEFILSDRHGMQNFITMTSINLLLLLLSMLSSLEETASGYTPIEIKLLITTQRTWSIWIWTRNTPTCLKLRDTNNLNALGNIK